MNNALIMVNIFGDRGKGNQGLRGVPGPVGPTGARGSKGSKGDTGRGGIDDACRWMPQLVLEQYQKNETCCFTLADPKKDLLKGPGGVYTTWISHTNVKKNAVADDHPSKHVIYISKPHNALAFDKSLYWVDDVVISWKVPQSYTCICVTFQIEGEDDQFIVSDYSSGSPDSTFRGISASNKEIRIWGAKNHDKSYLPIPHKTKRTEWTTLLVEWSNINRNEGSYILNNKKELGTFICTDIGGGSISAVAIGAKDEMLSQSLKGAISALEIYVARQTRENGIPDALKYLIINSQLIETKPHENEEPPAKKKKRNLQPISE